MDAVPVIKVENINNNEAEHADITPLVNVIPQAADDAEQGNSQGQNRKRKRSSNAGRPLAPPDKQNLKV